MTMTAVAITPSVNLISQQAELELEMTKQGIERFRASIQKAQTNGREDGTDYGTKLLDSLITKVSEGITAFMVERKGTGRAGPKGPAYNRLNGFKGDHDVVAYIALRIVLAGLSGKMTSAPAVAGRIGRAVEDEFRYRHIREQDRKFYASLQEEANQRNAYHVKRRVVNFHINKREMEQPDSWPEKDVVALGSLILEVIISTTGLVQVTKVEMGKHQSKSLLEATEATQQFIKDRVASTEMMRPLYEPMIVQPEDWTGPFTGGYLTRRVRPLRLVKSHNRKYLNSLAAQDMTEVCAAVNTAQRTAWAINDYILVVLDMAWEKDHSIGGIPTMLDAPIPPKPFDIETNEPARKVWRGEAHAVHMENLEMASKRYAFLTATNIAHRYSMFDAIYFPYQLDFRGRIYAAPQLNPQGPDWMKAMLQFSEGKPLDEEGASYLAIHLANTGAFGKIDKAPLEDRVQWVHDNQEAIIACADSPFENRMWTEADSPYCFLAACREWAGWVREGVGFVSHLPVALDGSCSGIQHFSMALADEVGGAAVNLVPSDKPADIYTLVLNKVVEALKAEAAGGGDNAELAAQWLRSGLLNRSCFKRPTMTYGYGSGQFGFRDQILNDTLKPAHKAYKRDGGAWHFEDNGFGAALYLSKVTLAAVEATVLKAAEAMAWLKVVAQTTAKENLPVRWTTPDGFLVIQDYKEQSTHRIDTMLLGKRTTVVVSQDTANVDKRKQASGFSPNFVHSLDAAHLRLTVRRAAEEGISAFALVHDSFGTHAADTARFFTILRETMVEMYRGKDTMDKLHAEIASQLSEKGQAALPQPPTLGLLDIEAVVDCDFAFA
jgi:DNA-directed RNA polymerase